MGWGCPGSLRGPDGQTLVEEAGTLAGRNELHRIVAMAIFGVLLIAVVKALGG